VELIVLPASGAGYPGMKEPVGTLAVMGGESVAFLRAWNQSCRLIRRDLTGTACFLSQALRRLPEASHGLVLVAGASIADKGIQGFTGGHRLSPRTRLHRAATPLPPR
jgi:hypothetical protein